MRRRAKVFFATAASGALLAVGAAAPSVSAAPIECPGNQTAVHEPGSPWYCENSGGNESGAGWHNGNHKKI